MLEHLHAGSGGVYTNVTLIVSIYACDILDFSTLSVIDALRTFPLKGIATRNEGDILQMILDFSSKVPVCIITASMFPCIQI